MDDSSPAEAPRPEAPYASFGTNSTPVVVSSVAYGESESYSQTNFAFIILFLLMIVAALLVLFGVAYFGVVVVARGNANNNNSNGNVKEQVEVPHGQAHVEDTTQSRSGPPRWIMILSFCLSLVAFGASTYGTATCDFLSVMQRSETIASVGVWSFAHEREVRTATDIYYPDTCYTYKSVDKPDDDYYEEQQYLYGKQNTALHTAQAASVLVLVFGLISAGMALYLTRSNASATATSTPTTSASTIVLALLILCTILFQGLTLLVLQSDVCQAESLSCEFSFGAYYSTVSLGYWFLAGCATMVASSLME